MTHLPGARLAAALAIALAGAPRAAQDAAEPPPAEQEVAVAPAEPDPLERVAAELAALADGATADAVAQRLAALDAGALFEALGRAELPLGVGAPPLGIDALPLVGALPLGERERATLLAGARLHGRAAMLRLAREAAGAPDAARRRTAIELAGLLGDASDLDTALRAATPLDPREPIDPAAGPLLEAASARLVARDAGTLLPLRPAILHAPPTLASHLIRAARAAGERALPFLEDLLGFDERLDLPLLSEVARAARASAPPFDERLRARVRSYLGRDDRQVARAAVLAVAALRDEDALPRLLELCATDPRLADSAFLALERVTGLSLPRRAELWLSWFREEQRWAREQGGRADAALSGRHVPQMLAALRAVAPRRLERQRRAELVAPLLEHEEASVRLEACRTLAALGCPSALDALRRARADSAEAVAAAAADALSSLEGAQLALAR